jgi:WD40 repeat protein
LNAPRIKKKHLKTGANLPKDVKMRIRNKVRALCFLTILCYFLICSPPVLGVPVYLASSHDFLYVAHLEGIIEIFNKTSGVEVKRIQTNISTVSFAFDGNRFYQGSRTGKIYVYDVEGQIVNKLNITSDSAAAQILTLDDESEMLYVGSIAGELLAMNLSTSSVTAVSKERQQLLQVIIPKDDLLYAISADGLIKLGCFRHKTKQR